MLSMLIRALLFNLHPVQMFRERMQGRLTRDILLTEVKNKIVSPWPDSVRKLNQLAGEVEFCHLHLQWESIFHHI